MPPDACCTCLPTAFASIAADVSRQCRCEQTLHALCKSPNSNEVSQGTRSTARETHLCAVMAAMVSTLPPAAAVTLPSRCGLSALPTDAASSPVADMLGPRTAGCPGQPPDPACDNRGMLLLSDGAVLLLMDTNEASDLQNQ
jgi:hypothetical protein